MTRADIFIDYCLSMGYSHEQMTAAADVFEIKPYSKEKWFYFRNFSSLIMMQGEDTEVLA